MPMASMVAPAQDLESDVLQNPQEFSFQGFRGRRILRMSGLMLQACRVEGLTAAREKNVLGFGLGMQGRYLIIGTQSLKIPGRQSTAAPLVSCGLAFKVEPRQAQRPVCVGQVTLASEKQQTDKGSTSLQRT